MIVKKRTSIFLTSIYGENMFKKMISLIGILLLVGTVYGEAIYIEDLTIKDSNNYETTKPFTINKVENQAYDLSFVHYGNVDNITVVLYLNNYSIFIIKKDHLINFGNKNKPTISIDITDRIVNGKNNISLKLVEGNPAKNQWYKLNRITISTQNPPIKTPVPLGAIAISLIGVLILLVRHHENN